MAKILMADDDQVFQGLILDDLQDYNARKGNIHQIDAVSDGSQAIASLQKSVSEIFYNILLTDYQMGRGPDGVDVIEEAIRLGVSKIFIMTNVEFNPRQEATTSLTHKLQEAVLKHKVTHIDKCNHQSFVEKVYGYLDAITPTPDIIR